MQPAPLTAVKKKLPVARGKIDNSLILKCRRRENGRRFYLLKWWCRGLDGLSGRLVHTLKEKAPELFQLFNADGNFWTGDYRI